jgi:hypothetical protein
MCPSLIERALSLEIRATFFLTSLDVRQENSMSRLRTTLTLLLVAVSVACVAQEEDEEELVDVSSQIREAENEEQLLTQRLELTGQRIKLLKESRTLRLSLNQLGEQIEIADGKGDERKVEQLKEQSEAEELQLEFSHAKLGILEYRFGLLHIQGELFPRELEPLRRDSLELTKTVDLAAVLVEELFKVYREGPEEKKGKLEEQLEELQVTFEQRQGILQLKLKLHYAREEGEEDEIRELERILKNLTENVEAGAALTTRPVVRNRSLPIELTAAEIAKAGTLDFQQQIVPLLKHSCFECHDQKSASGDLNLDELIRSRPLVTNRTHWINVIQQLKVRSMPPAEADQPDEPDRRTMAAWLTNAIVNFDYSTVRQPGYEPARRLTHDEYNNTIRDLTGIDLRPADRFPADLTATSGFKNSANSLFLQPITLERYIGAAESIAMSAWPDEAQTAGHRAAWKRLLGKTTDLTGNGAVKTVLLKFVQRAWRRPVEPRELSTLLSHYEDRVAGGATPRGALRDVLQVMLVSPSFLIRTERDGPVSGKPFRVTDWELASRLSYFLWASMPDDELFRLAETDRLHEPDVLVRQITRMLRDPKAESLGSIFASQWLGFTDLGRVRPGQIDNPWATDSLIAAMKDESAMLFNSVVSNDAQLDRLLDADYTFLNEELARHYGIKGVTGTRMRQISLRGTPRRGVLGHGSILAVTSFPGRTSPVIRGNWILTKLLGTPPPPPPPNVSDFDERVAGNRKLTQRQKLELHRVNPNCYACHSQIDPLGFALEEFEWFGRHRPQQRGKTVDSTGQLPGGKPFQGLPGLSQALLTERIDDLTTQISRKLLSYALGRQLEYYDEATVSDLVEAMQKNERRLPSLILAIVQSDTFQMKQLPVDPADK